MLEQAIRYIFLSKFTLTPFLFSPSFDTISYEHVDMFSRFYRYIYHSQSIKMCTYVDFCFILAYSASCSLEVFCKKVEVCMKVRTKHVWFILWFILMGKS